MRTFPLLTLRAAAPFVALFALATPALGANAPDQALAEALFQDAKRMLAAGDAAGALPKFLESQRLDPSAGTLLNIADAYEKLDRLSSAWGAFKEAESTSKSKGDTARADEAARRAGLLSLKLSKLAIVVPPSARVPGFELKRDGSSVGEAQWGTLLPIDVGSHALEASAPGYKPWATTVRIETDGASTSIEVQPLVKEASPAAAPFWTGQRVAGVTVSAAGVVGLAIGAAFGARAISQNSNSKAQCQPQNPSLCSASGVALYQDAVTSAHVSTGALVIGGAAAVAGVVVVLVAPSAKAPEKAARVEVGPVVGGGTRGLLVRAIW